MVGMGGMVSLNSKTWKYLFSNTFCDTMYPLDPGLQEHATVDGSVWAPDCGGHVVH